MPLKYNNNKNTWHEIFIKEFQQKKQSHPLLPDGKTILVSNVPPYVNEIHLKFGFCRAGPVAKVFCVKDPNDLHSLESPPETVAESVYFPTKQSDDMFQFKSAFVVFENSKATRKAMTLNQIELFVDNGPILITGIPKWTQEYMSRQTNETDLEQEIEGYLDVFDARDKDAKTLQQSAAANEDDEGWQTVGKSGRIPKFVQSEQVLKRLQNKIDFGTKKKELADFYRFQKNDGHKNRKRTLKAQFSEETEKLEELKQKKRMKKFDSNFVSGTVN